MLKGNAMRDHTIRLRGGLDTSNSFMAMSDGCVIGSSNYEEVVVEGGYTRVAGYERFDGRPRPSDAQVSVLKPDAQWLPAASVGVIATGAISGATGVVCYYSTTLLGLTKVAGDFAEGEQILVGASPVGTSSGTPSVDPLVMNDIYAGAEAVYRADIGTVPGSGPITGAFVLNGEVFALRNNFGGTGQLMYRATNAGWVAVPLHQTIRFSAGSSANYNGLGFIVTQGGVTATAYKMMVESGDLAAGTAVGTLVVGAASGGALAAGAASGAGAGGTVTLTLSGAATAITLAPSGRWQFKTYRFSLVPSSVDEVVYGVDRVANTGGGNFIEFDGNIIAPMTAGGIDGPYRLECHKNHLFVVYRRTSVQFSGLGDPYRWSVLAGAGEMLAGEQVTELLSVQGSEDQAAMLVMCLNRSFILYGNSSADFKLVPLSRQVGAKQYSAQTFGAPLALDDQGVRSFAPTANFGNFTYNTLTNHIRKKVVEKEPTASALDRKGGHYRLYFDDGTWLSGTPGKRWSWMECRYPFTVNFAQDWELDGETVILAGGASGYLYMLDKGRSFDGEPIEAWLKLAYSHFGAPQMRKAFRGAQIEIRGDSAGALKLQADFSFGSSQISAKSPAYVTNNPVPPPATPWDLGAWDIGTWDSQYATVLRVRSEGNGENVSLTAYSNAANELPHLLSTVQHFYLERRKVRAS